MNSKSTEPVNNTTLPSERSFGIVFTLVFMIIGLWPLLYSNQIRLWAISCGAIILVISVIYPKILRMPNYYWFKFGLLLHKIISPIIMGLIFFCVVTPTGLLMRLIKGDLIHQHYDKNLESYWISRDKSTHPIQPMKNQF